MKKLLGILTICALIASLAVPSEVMAATNSTWIQENGTQVWHYTDGTETDLVAKVQDNTLYIQATGRFPNMTGSISETGRGTTGQSSHW